VGEPWVPPRWGTYTRVMPPALAVRGLGKRYGRIRALDDVDLELAEGELVGLLGPKETCGFA
jgi:ABC-type branched-subunit amino acid transport system ATPase component